MSKPFAKAYASLNVSATLKHSPADFVVEEIVNVKFTQQGEHCWLYLQKQNCNTDWVAQQLANFCGVKNMNVSYAGLKDRHAITSQWFSVQLPGKKTPDWENFIAGFNQKKSTEQIKLLKTARHNRKLKRGALQGNHFTVRLKHLSQTNNKTFESLTQRCLQIAKIGVPNYFGAQRFGFNLNNLEQASRFFDNPRRRLARNKRSIYLSAARSWLFNQVLSWRVEKHIWNKALEGDVFMLEGKSACFADDNSNDLAQRIDSNEIHPTAPLWGDGVTMVKGATAQLETKVLADFGHFKKGLEQARLKQQRRSCRVIPENMSCHRLVDDFIISFSLTSGSYATVVLDEIISKLKMA